MKCRTAFLFPVLLCTITVCTEAAEIVASENPFCPPATPFFNKYRPPQSFAEDAKDETRIGARQVQNIDSNTSIFEGDVLIEQDNFVLQADRVNFNQQQQQLDISGNIRINTPGLQIKSHHGQLDLENNSGQFSDNHYLVPGSNFQGKTNQLSITAKQHTLLKDTFFSSCPLQQQDWYLSMSELDLNHQTNTGSSTHASLWFKNVPIFYWPYLSFPIGDARRSGFLMPSFADSSSRGTEIIVPWYWNIAPNQDAIITPRYMSKRGNQLNSRYRYLGKNSKAQLDLEFLANDKQTQTERYFIKLNQQVDLPGNSHLELLFNELSDTDYFTDLGNTIYSKNIINVERKATLSHSTSIWNSRVMLQAYRTIDDTIGLSSRPYRRLPQIQINGQDRFSYASNLSWSLDTEWVDFAHEDPSQVVGQRADLYPRLSWPVSGDAWFINASSGYRLTQYKITDPNNPGLQLDTRKLNISSLDAGLLLERSFSKNKLLQTLEPRLFYLHIPYQQQDNIPLFDTRNISDFSFAQLFRENRFNGIDRIGDANQFTLAISSRLMDIKQGKELAAFQIGQIFYNTNQRVSLNGTPNTALNHSNVIAEASSSFNRWRLRATVEYNPQTRLTDKRLYQLSFAENNENIFNIGYRFRRNPADVNLSLEQSDISFRWPISPQYALLSRWNYSLTEQRNIDSIIGLEYESCCWSLRLISQSYLRPVTNDYENSFRFQLIFKGFGSISDRKANDILKRAIIGYQPEK